MASHVTCQIVVHYCLLKSIKQESVCCTVQHKSCFPPIVLQTVNSSLWIFYLLLSCCLATKIIPLSKLLPLIMQKCDAASFPLDKKVALLEIFHTYDDNESAFFLQIRGDKGSQLWPLCKWLLEAKWVSSRPFLDYNIDSGGVWLFHIQLFLWLHLSQNVRILTYLFESSGIQLHCAMHSKLE